MTKTKAPDARTASGAEGIAHGTERRDHIATRSRKKESDPFTRDLFRWLDQVPELATITRRRGANF